MCNVMDGSLCHRDYQVVSVTETTSTSTVPVVLGYSQWSRGRAGPLGLLGDTGGGVPTNMILSGDGAAEA